MNEIDLASHGPLPDFLIVGVAKAATSALWMHLAAHPEIYMSEDKELSFFTDHYARGEAWYREQFAPGVDAKVRGEATPHYLPFRHALERMRAMVPDARLIVVLRHPVDRAYSHYWYHMSMVPDRRPSIDDFVRRVRAEMAGATEADLAPHAAYLRRSAYTWQLRQLCELYPREQLHVVLQDDLRRAPHETFSAVCRFIGVDDTIPPLPLEATINQATRLRSTRLRAVMLRRHLFRRFPRLSLWLDARNRVVGYPPLPRDVHDELTRWFDADVAELEVFLDRDLSAWRLPTVTPAP